LSSSPRLAHPQSAVGVVDYAMSSPSPVPDTGTVRSDSAASTRDSAKEIAEIGAQAIALLQKADAHTVVAGLLKEKNYLHAQNGQLWRLVDKQRAAYSPPARKEMTY
jgi:hypothetical protein